MVTLEEARQIALSMPGTEEHNHFGLPAFRTKRIFATLWVAENKMMVKLGLIDQSVFCSFNKEIFYPVPNKYGSQGATFVELAKVDEGMLRDAITTAWQAASAKTSKSKR